MRRVNKERRPCLKFDMKGFIERAMSRGFTKDQAMFLANEVYGLFLVTALQIETNRTLV